MNPDVSTERLFHRLLETLATGTVPDREALMRIAKVTDDGELGREILKVYSLLRESGAEAAIDDPYSGLPKLLTELGLDGSISTPPSPDGLVLFSPQGVVPLHPFTFLWASDREGASFELTLTNASGGEIWRAETTECQLSMPDHLLPLEVDMAYHWTLRAISCGEVLATAGASFTPFLMKEEPAEVTARPIPYETHRIVRIKQASERMARPRRGVVTVLLAVAASVTLLFFLPRGDQFSGVRDGTGEVSTVRIQGPAGDRQDPRPLFRWDPAGSETEFRVVLRTADFQPVFQETTRSNALPFPDDAEPLRPGATYVWEVSWKDDAGRGHTAQATFTVRPDGGTSEGSATE